MKKFSYVYSEKIHFMEFGKKCSELKHVFHLQQIISFWFSFVSSLIKK